MNIPRLKKIINSFSEKKILVLGDIMLDHFIRGKVARISPEAPVPVVCVKNETFLPGGAGNVASNLASLGAEVSIISVLGKDLAGNILINSLKQKGIDTSKLVYDVKRPTTEKVRIIAEHQQVVRYDREKIDNASQLIREKIVSFIKSCTKNYDAVILSDYNKGVLSDQSIKAAIQECSKNKIPILVDPNIEHFKKYKRVTCITPNTSEAWSGMRLIAKEDQKYVEELGRKILKTLNLKSLLITQGPKGMTLFEKSSKIFHIPTAAQEVYDVTGAGDTAISAFSLSFVCGASFKEAALISNYAAGIVVGKLGTATTTQKELTKSLGK